MGATFNPTPNDVLTACKKDCALIQIDKFVTVLKSSTAADTGDKKIAISKRFRLSSIL
jgi:hypothetical protein